MPWFKVDDGFDDHPKVLAAGNAAIGLWTRCGAYSSRYLLEGFVPAEVAKAKGSRSEIAHLVAAGLWSLVDGGYQMHDFLDYNPSGEQTKDRRAKTAERQQRWRHRHADRDTAVRNGDRNGVSDGAPDPTRPDPSSLTSTEQHPPYAYLSPASGEIEVPKRPETDEEFAELPVIDLDGWAERRRMP